MFQQCRMAPVLHILEKVEKVGREKVMVVVVVTVGWKGTNDLTQRHRTADAFCAPRYVRDVR